jgi:hypothetical protein
MPTPSSGAISWSQIQAETGGAYSMYNFNAVTGRGYDASDYYNYSASPITVYYENNETTFGGDANLRINVWNASGTQVVSDLWFWGTSFGDITSATGVTLYAGFTVQVYAINWGASYQNLSVYQEGTELYNVCAWSEVGPYTFTLVAGNYYDIINVSNSCS